MNLQNKTITILGAGLSGQAAARFVKEKGGIPRISESKKKDQIDSHFLEWLCSHGVVCEFGKNSFEFIKDSGAVVVSPGIRLNTPLFKKLQRTQIPVIGEIELAYRFCPKPIIAVTGSNGKTTVVTLVHQILNACGLENILCGNIGRPFSQEVLKITDQEFVVLEVSSFQLETIQMFKPYIAVFLNFSQNHLDRHANQDEYFEAKCRMFKNQQKEDCAILNGRDDRIRNFSRKLKSRVFFFEDPEASQNCWRDPNFSAALEVARVLDLPFDRVQKVLSEFQGIEHRLEPVRQINGIAFVNDAKSTTIEAGRRALLQTRQPVIMICGGRDKNSDFSSLKNLVREKVKKMFVIGEAKEKIKAAFSEVVDIEECDELQNAVDRACLSAKKGDAVVFSPMCASFDMFDNFEERGRVFKNIVLNLERK